MFKSVISTTTVSNYKNKDLGLFFDAEVDF